MSRVLSGLRRKGCIRIELFPPSPEQSDRSEDPPDARDDGRNWRRARLHGDTVGMTAPRFRGGERRAFAGEMPPQARGNTPQLLPTELDSPEDEPRRRQTDSSREESVGAVAVGDAERSSSSSSSKVSEEEGKARTPDVEVPHEAPEPHQDDDQGEPDGDDRVPRPPTRAEAEGPVEDPARRALIARVDEIADGNLEVRRALLDAVPDLLKRAKMARSASPLDARPDGVREGGIEPEAAGHD